ncbi:MAG TPA: LysM peptidoglycan-binding domain-containing protein [Opitutaceae bacterium]|jgi:LysM repeat protein
MLIPRLALATALGLMALPAVRAQFANGANTADVNNLREDITGLDQRLAELSLRIEQLENHASRADAVTRTAALPPNAVTQQQLADAVASLSAQITELRIAVGKLATVPAAPSAASTPVRAQSRAEASPGTFSHEGTIYTVQKGDTLALIAKKTGGRFQEIVTANRLADPSHIVIGQQLFIPGGK